MPTDQSGRVLDRRVGLGQIIRPEDGEQAHTVTGRVNSRKCMLIHKLVHSMVLAMGLFTDLPIRTGVQAWAMSRQPWTRAALWASG